MKIFMRKKVWFVSIAVVFFLGLFLYKTLYRSGFEFYNPQGNWKRCWKDGPVENNAIRDWQGKGVVNVEFIHQGSSNCQGMYYPVIRGEYKKATHWIHVVEANVPAEKSGTGWQLTDDKNRWIFVDSQPQTRNEMNPFYSTGPQFNDNPSWSRPRLFNLHWIGHAFPVLVEGNTITPLAGFSWGFNFSFKDDKPTGLAPQSIAKNVWDQYRNVLSKEYPNWSFR